MLNHLDRYLAEWNLSDPHPLAQTFTSHLYMVQYQGQPAVLKLLTPIGVSDEQAGAIALTCFNGHGAARLLQHNHEAHLLEYIDGNDLVPMVKQAEDEQATGVIVEVLNQLHNAYTGIPPEGLHSLNRWFRSLFNKAETDLKAGEKSIYISAAKIAKDLLASQREQRVLHGDIHHQNIRYHSKRGWLAFDPKGLYGERTYDAANTLLNPINIPELVTNEARLLRNATVLANGLGIPLPRLLAFTYAYACLSAAWSLEDGADESLALAVAAIIKPHLKSSD